MNTRICAPPSCPIGVQTETSSVEALLARYTNFTRTQFLTWNPSIDTRFIGAGEVFCVGPPGGLYEPIVDGPAQPTIRTTTASHAQPTPPGTVDNCGLYYTVQPGDYCQAIALRFGITFSGLVDMNPSLDSSCSNLLAGFDYW